MKGSIEYLILLRNAITEIVKIKEWAIKTGSRCHQSWMAIKEVTLGWRNQVTCTVTAHPNTDH